MTIGDERKKANNKMLKANTPRFIRPIHILKFNQELTLKFPFRNIN